VPGYAIGPATGREYDKLEGAGKLVMIVPESIEAALHDFSDLPFSTRSGTVRSEAISRRRSFFRRLRSSACSAHDHFAAMARTAHSVTGCLPPPARRYRIWRDGSGRTAGGADLQFKSELPPQIEEVRDCAILAEQESMKTLQSRRVHANDALRGYVCSQGSVLVHGVNTMNALYGADSKSKRGNPACSGMSVRQIHAPRPINTGLGSRSRRGLPRSPPWRACREEVRRDLQEGVAGERIR
jgi:hypothetical protein